LCVRTCTAAPAGIAPRQVAPTRPNLSVCGAVACAITPCTDGVAVSARLATCGCTGRGAGVDRVRTGTVSRTGTALKTPRTDRTRRKGQAPAVEMAECLLLHSALMSLHFSHTRNAKRRTHRKVAPSRRVGRHKWERR